MRNTIVNDVQTVLEITGSKDYEKIDERDQKFMYDVMTQDKDLYIESQNLKKELDLGGLWKGTHIAQAKIARVILKYKMAYNGLKIRLTEDHLNEKKDLMKEIAELKKENKNLRDQIDHEIPEKNAHIARLMNNECVLISKLNKIHRIAGV